MFRHRQRIQRRPSRDASNQVAAQLVRDGNIGGILSRTDSAGTSYRCTDGSGNVTILTDESGAAVGRPTSTTPSATRSRSMARWINRDPIRESGGVNLHPFAGNHSVNAVGEYKLFSSVQRLIGGTERTNNLNDATTDHCFITLC